MMEMLSNEIKSQWWQSLNAFDIFVFLGGLVNLLVIGFLLGYWLLHWACLFRLEQKKTTRIWYKKG